jgi:predicted  nucleic acid-binding Zn-ribbon protein
MKKKISGFSVCCVVFLFVFAAFMVWYIPSMSSLQTKITDTRQSLETSRGRENKQQDEYDKAVADLPVIKAELAEKAPLAEAAEQEVTELKARRKELRQEKKALEEKLAQSEPSQEGNSNE